MSQSTPQLDMSMMLAIHSAFRRDLDRLTAMAERRDPDRPVVTKGWETLKVALHGHHHAEDDQLWPIARAHLEGRDDDLTVLDAMEAEHATLDPLIRRIDEHLTDGGVADDDLAEGVAAFRDALSGHLAHEEREALPILQRAVSPAEWQAFEEEQGKRYGLKATLSLLPWITEDASAPTSQFILSDLPAPLRLLNRWVLAPRYRSQQRW